MAIVRSLRKLGVRCLEFPDNQENYKIWSGWDDIHSCISQRRHQENLNDETEICESELDVGLKVMPQKLAKRISLTRFQKINQKSNKIKQVSEDYEGKSSEKDKYKKTEKW